MQSKLARLKDALDRHLEEPDDIDHEALQAQEQADFEQELARLATLYYSNEPQGSSASSSSSFSFPGARSIYLRRTNPTGYLFREKLHAAAVALELDHRANDIEEFDVDAHKKVLALLSDEGSRTAISMDEYLDASRKFDAWRATKRRELAEQHAQAQEDDPQAGYLGSLAPRMEPRLREVAPMSTAPYATIAKPRLTVDHFLSVSMNTTNKTVEVKPLFQLFAKQVALLKCEAELTMWDGDADGKLTEPEVSAYVRYLIPSLESIKNISEGNIPFYCCAVVRMLFWVLDPTSRGFIYVSELLKSPLMEEWIQLQLTHEENEKNWFGRPNTSALYEKFMRLETSGTGMLTLANMKAYKKGIPTVFEDGLPPDVSPLSSLFLERYFELTPLFKSEMDYKNFVDFVIAVEFLPQCHRPQFFWNILDLDGTGVITPMTAVHFFRDNYHKLEVAGVEPPPLELIIQELFDVIPTKEPLTITKQEFMRSSQNGLFVALLIDCLSFWAYENREQR